MAAARSGAIAIAVLMASVLAGRACAALPVRNVAADDVITLVREIGPRLVSCWSAPHEGDEITIRLSFTRFGGLVGKPRITYLKSAAGSDGDADLANSIFEALRICTPMKFASALGSVIAGHVFTIRFIAPRRTQSTQADPMPRQFTVRAS